MLPIDNELIKRVENGDLIVRGSPDEIQKSNYEDGWYVLGKCRICRQRLVYTGSVRIASIIF
jgi:hypothetical protein